MNIAYFVHGRGRGHAVRAQSVLAALEQKGYRLSVFGGGHATGVLGGRTDFRVVQPCLPGWDWLPSLSQRLIQDLGELRKIRPALVISDADMPSIHAAAILGIPSIGLGHGIVFSQTKLPKGLPRWGRIRESLNAGSSSWLCKRLIAVHFAPLVPIDASRVDVARPELKALTEQDAIDEGFILTYFRDENGYKVLEQLKRFGRRVVYFGHAEVPPGVERHEPDAPQFADHLRRCHAVVGSAGNHLPAECALAGKPMLALYSKGDLEQQMNAHLAQEAGIAMAEHLDRVDRAKLEEFFETKLPTPNAVHALLEMRPVSDAVLETVAEILAA